MLFEPTYFILQGVMCFCVGYFYARTSQEHNKVEELWGGDSNLPYSHPEECVIQKGYIFKLVQCVDTLQNNCLVPFGKPFSDQEQTVLFLNKWAEKHF